MYVGCVGAGKSTLFYQARFGVAAARHSICYLRRFGEVVQLQARAWARFSLSVWDLDAPLSAFHTQGFQGGSERLPPGETPAAGVATSR
jgi:hypothetical protein